MMKNETKVGISRTPQYLQISPEQSFYLPEVREIELESKNEELEV